MALNVKMRIAGRIRILTPIFSSIRRYRQAGAAP
jgi:hypothetical protein